MGKVKKYFHDKQSDVFYIMIQEGKEDRFEELAPGIKAEYNDKNEIIGIEIIGVSRLAEIQAN